MTAFTNNFQKYFSLALWVAAFLLIGSVIGQMTGEEIPGWYESLNKSFLTPPDFVFGIVWSILYILIAICGWRIWHKPATRESVPVKALYGVQALMNWGWSYAFFYFHLLVLSFVWILVLIALVAVLIALLWKKDTIAGALLLPYLAWICFASYLSGTIWLLN